MAALEILYFAWVREMVGRAGERVTVPATIGTVSELIAWLTGQSPGHAAAFADPSRVRAAIDGRFVPLDAPLGAGREVALFPPVPGG